jgi:hypothetical protein
MDTQSVSQAISYQRVRRLPNIMAQLFESGPFTGFVALSYSLMNARLDIYITGSTKLDKFSLKFVQFPPTYPGKQLPSFLKIIASRHDSFYYQDYNNLTSIPPPRYPPHESRADPQRQRHPRHQKASGEFTAQLCPIRHRHQYQSEGLRHLESYRQSGAESETGRRVVLKE